MRETIAQIKAELKKEHERANALHNLLHVRESEIEHVKKDNADLEQRLAYADKVNLANIGILNFLKGQVSVFERVTDTQECDCEECLYDNPNNNA